MGWIATMICLICPSLSMCSTKLNDGAEIKFTNCGPDIIQSVNLSPCSTPDMCTFKHGDNVTVQITFTTAGVNVQRIQTKVSGIVAGIPVPFPLPRSDGCEFCNLTCPLTKGQHVYSNTFPVLSSYPQIKLPVKWELLDDSDTIICFVFPMAIDG